MAILRIVRAFLDVGLIFGYLGFWKRCRNLSGPVIRQVIIEPETSLLSASHLG